MTLTIIQSIKATHWKIFEISLERRNWDSIECAGKKILKVDICQQKLNGKYVGQHCTKMIVNPRVQAVNDTSLNQ